MIKLCIPFGKIRCCWHPAFGLKGKGWFNKQKQRWMKYDHQNQLLMCIFIFKWYNNVIFFNHHWKSPFRCRWRTRPSEGLLRSAVATSTGDRWYYKYSDVTRVWMLQCLTTISRFVMRLQLNSDSNIFIILTGIIISYRLNCQWKHY